MREEEIPLYSKTLKISNVSRAFNKENSVFAPWIQDTEQTIADCMKHDFAPLTGMKLARFIKDPVELQEVTDEIVSRYSELKDVFTGVVVSGG